MANTKSPMVSVLLAKGWTRSDEPAEWVGECVDVTGCSKPGRWTHAACSQELCAQHAMQSVRGACYGRYER